MGRTSWKIHRLISRLSTAGKGHPFREEREEICFPVSNYPRKLQLHFLETNWSWRNIALIQACASSFYFRKHFWSKLFWKKRGNFINRMEAQCRKVALNNKRGLIILHVWDSRALVRLGLAWFYSGPERPEGKYTKRVSMTLSQFNAVKVHIFSRSFLNSE